MVSEQGILPMVAAKASEILGTQITVVAEDRTAKVQDSQYLQQLIQYSKAHTDIINIKE